ncbi:MAG: glycosyltransferase family 4 protein [Gammaproteobacteria bacterium]
MPRVDLKSEGPKTIVLVIGGLEGGGAERILSDMAVYWTGKGWQVTLATWSGPELADFYPLPSSVHRKWLDVRSSGDSFLARARANFGRILELRRLLVESKPDVVLSFITVSNVLTIIAATGLQVRVVVSERTNPAVHFAVEPFWRALRRLCYRWADEVVVQTKDAAKWVEENCRVKPVVIPNSLRTLPDIRCEREPLIVAVGRLSKEKGFDILLEAFARISADFPGWRLAILGEGTERQTLLDLRDRLGLASQAELSGQSQEVETWMARSGLVVHPSWREGFPNVVLEAMGMGAAVVCTDCDSGPSELINDGINGRLVPVGDVDALARAMSDLMSKPDLRRTFGQEASRVRKHYEQGAIMERWEVCLRA